VELFRERDQLKQDIDLFNEYCHILGESGYSYQHRQRQVGGNLEPDITSKALGYSMPELAVATNRYLRSYLDDRFHVKTVLQNGIPQGDLEIISNESGKAVEYSRLSGGEGYTTCLSLAFGLGFIQSNGQNHNIGTLIIDEGFGSLDEEAAQDVVRSLRNISTKEEKDIIAIAHTEYLKKGISHKLELKRINNQTVIQS